MTKTKPVAIYNTSDLKKFVDTFGLDHKGTGAIANYAEFLNMDRSTIFRNLNSDKNPPGFHKTIERLVNERAEAKREVRRLTKLLKEQAR